jgi:hypothetical protein
MKLNNLSKLIKILLFISLSSVFISIVVMIVIGIYDKNNVSSDCFGYYVDTNIKTDKKEYSLNDEIELDISFQSNQPIQLKFCDNNLINYNLYFLEQKDQNLTLNESILKNYFYNYAHKSSFTENCTKECTENKGFVFIDSNKKFHFKVRLKFIKIQNKFYLASKNNTMQQITNGYDKIVFSLKESIMCSDCDNSDMLAKYFIVKINNEKLEINASNHDDEKFNFCE